jgi:hypothetical protein
MRRRVKGETWKEAVMAAIHSPNWRRFSSEPPSGVMLHPDHREKVAPTVAGLPVEFNFTTPRNYLYIFKSAAASPSTSSGNRQLSLFEEAQS